MRITHLLQFCPHGRLSRDHVVSGARGITGSEQALMAFAEASAAAGHRVVVYIPAEGDFLHNDVWYKDSASRWPRLEDLDEADCVVAWLSADPLVRVSPDAFRVMVLQINDWGMCSTRDTRYRHVDKFVVQSASHVESLWSKVDHPIDRERIVVIPNGIRAERFVGSSRRIKDRLIACSSPDRGVHWMLYLWPQIKQAVPTATLHIFYEVMKWAMSAVQHANEIGQRARYMLDVLPTLSSHGVVLRGAVSPEEIAKELLRSDFMTYPCDTLMFSEGFCHPPGTRILTDHGEKEIERLSLSDRVLTHKGRWGKIESVSQRRFCGDLVRITPFAGESVSFTPEHPILAHPPTSNRGPLDRNGFLWTKASDIRKGWYLYSPSLKQEPCDSGTLAVPKRLNAEIRCAQNPPQIPQGLFLPDHIKVTKELCRFIGYFSGDGNANKRGRSAVSIFFGIGEPMETDDCETCAVSVFGAKPTRVDFSPRKKMIALRWHSSQLSYALAMWCYDEQGRKVLPSWCLNLSLELTKEVLKGLWRTDGSVFITKKTKARVATFTSSSLALISQVRVLLAKLGYRVAVFTRKHSNGHESYSICFSTAGEFLDYPSRVRRSGSSVRGRITDDGEFGLPIRKIETVPYNGNVLYLGVAEDLSYQVGNFSAHNSCSTMEACAAGTVPIMTDADALGEIYKDSGAVMIPRNATGAWIEQYRDAVISMLQHGTMPGDDLSLDDRRKRCRTFAADYDYSVIGARFNDLLETGMAEKAAHGRH